MTDVLPEGKYVFRVDEVSLIEPPDDGVNPPHEVVVVDITIFGDGKTATSNIWLPLLVGHAERIRAFARNIGLVDKSFSAVDLVEYAKGKFGMAYFINIEGNINRIKKFIDIETGAIQL